MAAMEYQDLLRLLAENPPRFEPEKRMHAKLLEMLAKKLRGDRFDIDLEALKDATKLLNHNKKYH